MSLREPELARRDGLRLAVAIAAAAAGVLVIALSFAAGRAEAAGADALLWAGRLLIWVPLMLLVVAGGVPGHHRLAALVTQAATQSLVKWMYSPRDFRFPDELLHVRTALEVAAHDTLNVENPVLPISPAFPGLEAITDALASVGDMSIFTAGSIVAAVAHVALAAAVFGLARLAGLGDHHAAIAALVFAVAPQQPMFNAMFIYLTPALLLMVGALSLALGARAPRRLTAVLSLACVAGVIVTHHVTAIVTLLVLALGAVVAAARADRDRARRLAMLTAGGVALAAGWLATREAEAARYLADPLLAMIGVTSDAVQGEAELTSASPGAFAVVLAYSAFAVAGILVALGALALWWRGGSVRRSAAVGAAGYFAVLGGRVLTGDGELATRAMTYVLLPGSIAIAIAIVLVAIWTPGAARWRAAATGATLTLLFTGFSILGWPPSWESVPGRFRIAAFESGIDAANTGAARWATAGIGPHRDVACDLGSCSLFGAYPRANALADASPLFYARQLGSRSYRYIAERGLQFAVVDVRLSRDLPITGRYFRNDVGGPEDRPIALAALRKFDRGPAVSRLYDNGTVRIYDLRRERRRDR